MSNPRDTQQLSMSQDGNITSCQNLFRVLRANTMYQEVIEKILNYPTNLRNLPVGIKWEATWSRVREKPFYNAFKINNPFLWLDWIIVSGDS